MTLRAHMLLLLEATKADRKHHAEEVRGIGSANDFYDKGAMDALDRVIERIERILETVEAAR